MKGTSVQNMHYNHINCIVWMIHFSLAAMAEVLLGVSLTEALEIHSHVDLFDQNVTVKNAKVFNQKRIKMMWLYVHLISGHKRWLSSASKNKPLRI